MRLRCPLSPESEQRDPKGKRMDEIPVWIGGLDVGKADHHEKAAQPRRGDTAT
jgi:hypothetical protein